MRYSTDVPPPSNHHYYSCSRPKNRTCPSSLMTPRSPPGVRSHHRPYLVYLTKTCPLRTSPTDSAYKLNPSYYSRPNINPRWRVRWTKPDSTPESPCLLLNCTPGLNNFNFTILPLPYPPYSPHLLYYNILNFPCI